MMAATAQLRSSTYQHHQLEGNPMPLG
jgi:hypothetical protein